MLPEIESNFKIDPTKLAEIAQILFYKRLTLEIAKSILGEFPCIYRPYSLASLTIHEVQGQTLVCFGQADFCCEQEECCFGQADFCFGQEDFCFGQAEYWFKQCTAPYPANSLPIRIFRKEAQGLSEC